MKLICFDVKIPASGFATQLARLSPKQPIVRRENRKPARNAHNTCGFHFAAQHGIHLLRSHDGAISVLSRVKD